MTTGAPAEPAVAAEPPRSTPMISRRGWRTQMLLGVVMVALLAGIVGWQWDRLADLPDILMDTSFGWMLAALAAQIGSIGMLARQQRQLIDVQGERYPLPSVVATTYAGNAISLSVPVVGPAAAAVFTFKRFTRIGVPASVAGWALTLSNVFQAVAYTAVTAVGAAVIGSRAATVAGVLTIVLIVLPVLGILIGLRYPPILHLAQRLARRSVSRWHRVSRRSGADDARVTREVDRIAELRLTPLSSVTITLLTVLNAAAKALCLALVVKAVTGDVPWTGILLAWSAAQGAQSLNITPGGLGVVEAALTVALVGIGVPAGSAVAVVLLYRLISLWFVLAAGAVTLLVIKGRSVPVPAT